jgi:hypothetical protein
LLARLKDPAIRDRLGGEICLDPTWFASRSGSMAA